MHAVFEPWSHPFMQRALLELLFVGVVGAVLGCWIVLYDLAYSAESLAHALFPGLVAAALLHRPLLATGFDRGSAHSLGARPLFVDLGLLALVAAAIVVGVQGLGNLLVLAVLIGPAATARLAARRVPAMMLAATAVAVACALAGLYLSYYADVAAGAAVAGGTVGVYVVLALTRLRPWRLSASRG